MSFVVLALQRDLNISAMMEGDVQISRQPLIPSLSVRCLWRWLSIIVDRQGRLADGQAFCIEAWCIAMH